MLEGEVGGVLAEDLVDGAPQLLPHALRPRRVHLGVLLVGLVRDGEGKGGKAGSGGEGFGRREWVVLDYTTDDGP